MPTPAASHTASPTNRATVSLCDMFFEACDALAELGDGAGARKAMALAEEFAAIRIAYGNSLAEGLYRGRALHLAVSINARRARARRCAARLAER